MRKAKYMYNGIPLTDYCKNNPEISYNSIKNYINKEMKKNPELTIEEIINNYMTRKQGNCKYYYLGIPLQQYCEENNISYNAIASCIYKNKNIKKLDTNECVELIIEEYTQFDNKYYYNGITLKQYCYQNNLPYYNVVSYIKRKISIGSKKSIDELIDEGINILSRYGIIHYYKGIPLKDYAEQNNLNFNLLRYSIIQERSKNNKQLQDIIDECVEIYQKFQTNNYSYDGIPLKTFCDTIGLNYNTLIQKYIYEYSDKIDIETAIKKIVDDYIRNSTLKSKYFFSNHSLSSFCNKNSQSYIAIWNKIKTIETKGTLLDREHIVEDSIKYYEDKLQIEKITNIFNRLKNNQINTIDEIKSICNYLYIDYDNVNDLINMNFTYNQAINMIWYFYDKTINNGNKIITDKKLGEIFYIIEKLKNNNINKIELYDLLGIYKSKLYDCSEAIILKQKKYIYKIIFSLCRENELKDCEDFENEIKYYLLKVIDINCLNNYRQMIKYINLTVNNYFKKYLRLYRGYNYNIALNSSFIDKDEKLIIDYIPNPEKLCEENNTINMDLLNVLSTLPSDDLKFIILRYQEKYTYKDLALHFNLSLDEVRQKDVKLLYLLQRKENVKILTKKM